VMLGMTTIMFLRYSRIGRTVSMHMPMVVRRLVVIARLSHCDTQVSNVSAAHLPPAIACSSC
ncbi:MAG TPA: hypothetical protein VFC35_10405, partial [Gemmatimonadaceae bacterium]|nr:hypothetical protein [Gemmatimonadaceae bacterium]